MAQKPAKRVNIPRRPYAGARPPSLPPKPRKPRATWPYVLLMMAAWGIVFGAIFFSHFLSSLPDVGT